MAKAKTIRPTNAAKVYSYIRFSTPEQAMGDSERRQLAAATAFAERRNLVLDESLRLIDRGKSGYHGVNRTEGMLGQFLGKVEAGEITPGSILLVENIDRLSREDVLTALETVTRLIKNAIIICTLQPEGEYSRDSIANGAIYSLVGQIQAAHESSRTKAKRVSESRDTGRRLAREEGKTLTRQLPAWVRDKNGKRVAIPAAAKSVRMIFAMKLKGLSSRAIEKKLNAEAPWMPPAITKNPAKRQRGGNGWRTSYIRKILSNRAVIGEYQPHKATGQYRKRMPIGEPIPGYFPEIVKPEVFYAVQKSLEANRGKGGKTGKASNLFRHLVKCAYCGGPMAFENKGEPPKNAKYLACDYGRRRYQVDGKLVCSTYRIKYDECEQLILDNCPRLRPEEVLPKADEKLMLCKNLRQRVKGLEGELAEINTSLDNLVDQVAHTKSVAARDRYETKLIELEVRKTELADKLLRDQQELNRAESSSESFAQWQSTLDTLRTALKADNPELRMTVQAHLRQFIKRIEVFASGHQKPYKVIPPDLSKARTVTETLKDGRKLIRYAKLSDTLSIREGDDFEEAAYATASEFFPEALKDKVYTSFIAHVAELRRTKAGRFIRVYFTSGSRVDLVPASSLADGFQMRHDRKEWYFVKPDLAQLWQDFSTKARKETVRQ